MHISDWSSDVCSSDLAFLTNVAEHVGPEARFLHQGMTSSDVLDTCLAVQLKQAADLLIQDLDELLEVLKRRAFEHKLTPTIGRSHGIHAEPRSEEHTSELQSLMRISYAVFCLKKKNNTK